MSYCISSQLFWNSTNFGMMQFVAVVCTVEHDPIWKHFYILPSLTMAQLSRNTATKLVVQNIYRSKIVVP